ncbi:winged helix-turn-helix transcriptional regulator [Methanoculleus sp. DTU007]|jgi:biotin operon repressor|uniref:Winged helix-turn-helix DNA-binding n=2 Tax=Methanoculleus thermophilus TaxID=2200 RepID=A0A1G8X4I1_9EURY|nr:winged helix-turn-helix transcriptional regulator [Methanoculleus sp. DTU007]NLN09121.1 winged helix-turn-helix transcriptional regulator [Methanoculleus thermophilus]SDJ85453.1 Winged helix-turn-helix DNA-binding [Methanoculleus thermophilus]
MAPMARQIIFRQIERPRGGQGYDDLEWFFKSLGIGEGRDIEQIAQRIVITLLEHQLPGTGVSVERISQDLEISSSRVNHHIRNLIDAGVVYRHKRQIYLRGNSLQSMVRELRKDALRVLDDLEAAAVEIDRKFGIDE